MSKASAQVIITGVNKMSVSKQLQSSQWQTFDECEARFSALSALGFSWFDCFNLVYMEEQF